MAFRVPGGLGLIPKSISLPLRQVTPDPFPELANSPLTPVACQIQESSHSTPASPMLRRVATPKSAPGSRDTSPSHRRGSRHRQGSHSLGGSKEEVWLGGRVVGWWVSLGVGLVGW